MYRDPLPLRIQRFLQNYIDLQGFCLVLSCRYKAEYAYDCLGGRDTPDARKTLALAEQAKRREELAYVVFHLAWYWLEDCHCDACILCEQGFDEDLLDCQREFKKRNDPEGVRQAQVLYKKIVPRAKCSRRVNTAIPVWTQVGEALDVRVWISPLEDGRVWGGDGDRFVSIISHQTCVTFGSFVEQGSWRGEVEITLTPDTEDCNVAPCKSVKIEVSEPPGYQRPADFKVYAQTPGTKWLRLTVRQDGEEIVAFEQSIQVLSRPIASSEARAWSSAWAGERPRVAPEEYQHRTAEEVEPDHYRSYSVIYGYEQRLQTVMQIGGQALLLVVPHLLGAMPLYEILSAGILQQLSVLNSRHVYPLSVWDRIKDLLQAQVAGSDVGTHRNVLAVDFGATYSVIATPERFEGKYFQAVRGVTIIKDDSNQRLTPSVVAVDRQGTLLVGRRAKARVGQQPAPIVCVKRLLGEEIWLTLGNQTLLPEEVSARILRYLKKVAEGQTKASIGAAVITVPAHFTDIQKAKMKRACELAELRVLEMLPEPVAAALAYCFDDRRDPLTIMTYDLGGGRFEIAIVRREEGEDFKIAAFRWDHKLSGRKFDERLAAWMVDRLNEQGYQLDVRPDSPELDKLLVLAETAKEELSGREHYRLNEPSTGILDAKGRPVPVNIEISRKAFEGLISDCIDRTIDLCRQALEQAHLKPKAIDEIVLVGGCSRIPLVARRLEVELGRRPRLGEPELCVAVGAAIRARQLRQG